VTEAAGGSGTDHMSRCTDDQIRREGTVLLDILLDNTILTSREPVSRARGRKADEHDIPKVADRLDITGVVPSEVSDATLEHKGDHGSGPSGIAERLESTLQRFSHFRE
jgi:hypothetical protein